MYYYMIRKISIIESIFSNDWNSDTNSNINLNAQISTNISNPNSFMFNPFLMRMKNQNPNPYLINLLGYGQSINVNQQPRLIFEQLNKNIKLK